MTILRLRQVEVFRPYGRSIIHEHPDFVQSPASQHITSGFLPVCSSVADTHEELFHLREYNGREEELYVCNNIVIWSRGNDSKNRQLVYSYSTENIIAEVLWSCFSIVPSNPLSRSIAILDVCRNIHVVDDDGRHFSATMPFPVRSIWAMGELGILVERRGMVVNLETGSNEPVNRTTTYFPATFSGESDSLPYIYSFTHPLDEIAPVMLLGYSLLKRSFVLDSERTFQVVDVVPECSSVLVYDGTVDAHKIFHIQRITEALPSFEKTQHAVSKENNMCRTLDSTSFWTSSKIHASGLHVDSMHGEFAPHSSHVLEACQSSLAAEDRLIPRNGPPVAGRTDLGTLRSSKKALHGSIAFGKLSDTPTTFVRTPSGGFMPSLVSTPTIGNRDLVARVCVAQTLSATGTQELITPQIGLHDCWTEQDRVVSTALSFNKATKTFVTKTLWDECFFCYLVPSLSQLRLCKITAIRKDKPVMVVTTLPPIPAKDVANIPKCNMIMVLLNGGTLKLFSGPYPLGDFDIAYQLLELPMSSEGRSTCSLSPTSSDPALKRQFNECERDSSSTTSTGPVADVLSDQQDWSLQCCDAKSDSSTTCTDPVPTTASVLQQHRSLLTCEGLVHGHADNCCFMQFGESMIVRVTVPPLASSYIVDACIKSLTTVLPNNVYMQFVAEFYAMQFTHETGSMTDHSLWVAFCAQLLRYINVDVITTSNRCWLSQHIMGAGEDDVLSVGIKRMRQSSEGSEEDWEFLTRHSAGLSLATIYPNLYNNIVNATWPPVKAEQQENMILSIGRSGTSIFHELPMITLKLMILLEDTLLDRLQTTNSKRLVRLLSLLNFITGFSKGSVYVRTVAAAFEVPLLDVSYTVQDCDVSVYEDQRFISNLDTLGRSEFQFLRWITLVLDGKHVPGPFDYSDLHANISCLCKCFARYFPACRALLTPADDVGDNRSAAVTTDETIYDLFSQVCQEAIPSGFLVRSPRMLALPFNIAQLLRDSCCRREKPDVGISGSRRIDDNNRQQASFSPAGGQQEGLYGMKDIDIYYDADNGHNLPLLCTGRSFEDQTGQQTNANEDDTSGDGMEHMTSNWVMPKAFPPPISKLGDPLVCWPLTVWPKDLRIREVRKCLQSSAVMSLATMQRPETVSVGEFTAKQGALLEMLCHRTSTFPCGRAMYTLRTLNPSPLERTKFPKMCYKAHIDTRTFEIESFDASFATLKWPKFHNGVAESLSVHHLTRMALSDAWTLGCAGNFSVKVEWAGYLFGMGLNGRLSTISPVAIYNVLANTDEMMTSALLCGLAASNHHTCDTTITKILAVHVRSMMEPTQAEIEPAFLTQVSALVGLGLLYAETFDEKITEIMLNEIANNPCLGSEQAIPDRESHSLCAALGLGLTCLGRFAPAEVRSKQNDHPTGPLCDWENMIVSTLRNYITGSIVPQDSTKNPRQDANSNPLVHSQVSSSFYSGVAMLRHYNCLSMAGPSCLALGMMFMRSERTAIADMLLGDDMRNIRPDILFHCIVGKYLILWSQIKPTTEWFEGQMVDKAKIDLIISTGNRQKTLIDAEAIIENYFYSMAAAGFLIGLKFAGQRKEDIANMLLKYLNRCLQIRGKHLDSSYSLWLKNGEKNTNRPKDSVNRTLDFVVSSLTVSACMIMAGTGYMPAFRLLRHLHNTVNPMVSYGVQFACHMAMGLLFLGGGRQTLQSDDLFSTACLLMSMMPPYPSSPDDIQFHVQFLRHFYVMATESTLLSFRHEKTATGGKVAHSPSRFQPVRVDVKVVYKDQSPRHQVICRSSICTQLPPLSTLREIYIEAPGYWPIDILEPCHFKTLRGILDSDGLICMKPKVSSDQAIPYELEEDKQTIGSSLRSVQSAIDQVIWEFSQSQSLQSNNIYIFNIVELFLERLIKLLDVEQNRANVSDVETLTSEIDSHHQKKCICAANESRTLDKVRLEFVRTKFVAKIKEKIDYAFEHDDDSEFNCADLAITAYLRLNSHESADIKNIMMNRGSKTQFQLYKELSTRIADASVCSTLSFIIIGE